MQTKDKVDAQLILRIGIDGIWTGSTFSKYFEALNDLYLFIGPWALLPKDWPDPDMDSPLLETLKLARRDVRVAKIRFESPGFTDLVGVGQVIGHLKEFLIALLHLSVNKKRTEAESERLAAEAVKLRAEANRIHFEAHRITEEALKLRAEADKTNAEAQKLRAEAELLVAHREELSYELFKARIGELKAHEYKPSQIRKIESAVAIQTGRLADSMEGGRIVSIDTRSNI